jgi:hypothetical protein
MASGSVFPPGAAATQQCQLQVVVGRDAKSVLHAALLQRLVDLRPGKGGIGPKRDFLTHPLLTLNLRQQHCFPAFGAVHVAGP